MDKERELSVVALMIEMYCRSKHKARKHELCNECRELLDYVKLRREKCPHGEEKPFCSNCPIHCYKPDMRDKIRAVMRYSGPRIVFRHPMIAARHLIESKRRKKKRKNQIFKKSEFLKKGGFLNEKENDD